MEARRSDTQAVTKLSTDEASKEGLGHISALETLILQDSVCKRIFGTTLIMDDGRKCSSATSEMGLRFSSCQLHIYSIIKLHDPLGMLLQNFQSTFLKAS